MMNKSTNRSSDIIDAKLEEHQLCGSKQCPGCGHKFEGKPDWVGLPAGVKFDPTDQELIEHLEAKVEAKDLKSHPLIDEFIPTIEGEDGICYTHPEKLPGVTRDGLSRHFFHRPSKAYTTGTRKRRKIQTECDLQGGETRWHKTGKTRPVMASGKQKGCKKILVLYTNFGKNRKPEKTNWVMHQYHLGQSEEEREGELVVSKIFYQTQPRQCNWRESSAATAEGSGEASSRREGGGGGGGGGSCSSKEIVIGQRDEVSASNVGGLMASYNSAALDMQQLKAQHFGFHSFRRSSFDEIGVGDASNVGDQSRVSGTCDEMTSHVPNEHQQHQQQQQQHHHQQQQQQQQHHHQIATTTFHNISRPSNPISTIISPPPNLLHTSINILDHDHDSFHVQRMMLQNETFQQHQQQLQQQQQQQHHKIGGRSASGLEELIMGCTSTHDHVKDESPITNPQEADWMKYSTFWPDPDHPDHHG